MNIKIKKLHTDAIIPKYQTNGSSGFDLHSIENIDIEPRMTVLVKTGLCISIPEGYEMQIRPRSGLSLKSKLRIANSPGTIDSDYTGEIGIIIDNIKSEDYTNPNGLDIIKIKKGDRIAQGVITPIIRAIFEEVNELPKTDRGISGFGSTGKN